jgi:hypothetical protein
MSVQRRATFVVAAGLIFGLVIGASLGVLWWRLVPRVPLVIRPDGSAPQGFQPEGYAASDVVFALLCLAAGIAVTIGLARMRREHLLSVLLAALLASAVGTAALWWVGSRLGSVDIEGLVATTETEVVVDGPLQVTLPAAYLTWALGSAVVVTILALADVMHGRWTARSGRSGPS